MHGQMHQITLYNNADLNGDPYFVGAIQELDLNNSTYAIYAMIANTSFCLRPDFMSRVENHDITDSAKSSNATTPKHFVLQHAQSSLRPLIADDVASFCLRPEIWKRRAQIPILYSWR
jgi:hypothetical protein